MISAETVPEVLAPGKSQVAPPFLPPSITFQTPPSLCLFKVPSTPESYDPVGSVCPVQSWELVLTPFTTPAAPTGRYLSMTACVGFDPSTSVVVLPIVASQARARESHGLPRMGPSSR